MNDLFQLFRRSTVNVDRNLHTPRRNRERRPAKRRNLPGEPIEGKVRKRNDEEQNKRSVRGCAKCSAKPEREKLKARRSRVATVHLEIFLYTDSFVS